METKIEKNYRIFPGELLWGTLIFYFAGFVLYLYNPIQILNGIVIVMLSLFSLVLAVYLQVELQSNIYRILNIVFSWVMHGFDALLNFMILNDGYIVKDSSFIIFKNVKNIHPLWYVLSVLIFKNVVSSIVFFCIERCVNTKNAQLQGMTFFELQKLPYTAIKNNSTYKVVKSLFIQDKETAMVDPAMLQA